jgi:hypothetical protein
MSSENFVSDADMWIQFSYENPVGRGRVEPSGGWFVSDVENQDFVSPDRQIFLGVKKR